jgi:hypothetical protein
MSVEIIEITRREINSGEYLRNDTDTLIGIGPSRPLSRMLFRQIRRADLWPLLRAVDAPRAQGLFSMIDGF